jgi:putative ABC transport system permease protein
MRHIAASLSLLRCCLLVAGANLAQHRVRLIVALAGTAVALLLLLLQFAFLDAARHKVTLLYDFFDFDLALVPETYQFLYSAGTFDRIRLTQARAAGGVEATASLNIRTTRWTEPQTGRRSSLLLIGIDDNTRFVRDPLLREGLGALRDSRSILIDAFAHPDYGRTTLGATGMIGGQEVAIAGHFELGLFFYAEGSAVVRNVDFPRLSGQAARETSIGLVRLADGADAAAAKSRLSTSLPRDIRVYTRAELIAQEREFFLTTRPLGIMLRIGMAIAFLVGTVILLQVLSAEIITRTKEFATLKAMGFAPAFVYGVGLLEAALLAVGAFLPAIIVGTGVLWSVWRLTHLATMPSIPLVGLVLVIALAMSLLAALTAVRPVQRADPAALY